MEASSSAMLQDEVKQDERPRSVRGTNRKTTGIELISEKMAACAVVKPLKRCDVYLPLTRQFELTVPHPTPLSPV